VYKTIIILATLVLAAHAQATTCSLTKENPKKSGSYDQLVFGPVDALKNEIVEEYWIISKDGNATAHGTNVAVSSNLPSEMKNFAGQTYVYMSKKSGITTMAIGPVAENSNDYSQNVGAIGTTDKMLVLVSGPAKLSLVCYDKLP
jgi:hypothetical protein